MKILLLEDDDEWAKKIETDFKKRIRGVSFKRIGSEWAFRAFLNDPTRLDFDIAIFDIMVRWASYDEVMNHSAMDPELIPPEVFEELNGRKRWRAGIRCRNLLNEASLARETVCPRSLFFTVLLPADLKDDLAELNGDTPQFVKSEGMDALILEAIRLGAR